MNVDNLLQNLLQALLAHMEIHLRKQFVLLLASVNKFQILWKNFVEDKTSQRGLYRPSEHLTVRHRLRDTHLDS